jgi:hypothetical protein
MASGSTASLGWLASIVGARRLFKAAKYTTHTPTPTAISSADLGLKALFSSLLITAAKMRLLIRPI